MNVETLREKVKRGDLIILLDVRDAEEIEINPFFPEPPKNYLNVPILPLLFASKEELEEKIFTALNVPVDTPIVTLCQSGGRSARACAQLNQYGWKAENLDGGYLAWSV